MIEFSSKSPKLIFLPFGLPLSCHKQAISVPYRLLKRAPQHNPLIQLDVCFHGPVGFCNENNPIKKIKSILEFAHPKNNQMHVNHLDFYRINSDRRVYLFFDSDRL